MLMVKATARCKTKTCHATQSTRHAVQAIMHMAILHCAPFPGPPQSRNASRNTGGGLELQHSHTLVLGGKCRVLDEGEPPELSETFQTQFQVDLLTPISR